VSGLLSDRVRRRKGLVSWLWRFGRSPAADVAGLDRGHVLAIRLADRIGKGMRSGPRDALVAAVTPAELRGRAFGFHRAMDHAGALLGPLVAAALLAAGLSLRWLFALVAIPGLLTVLVLVIAVREEPSATPAAEPTTKRRP